MKRTRRKTLSLVATIVLAAGNAAFATTLGLSPDGRFFTIDGVPTYLNGVSYYGAQSITTGGYRTADLDDMVADGYNWIRVWMYWEYPDGSGDVSVMAHDGAIRSTYMDRLKTLISDCDARGIIVDCSFNHDGNGDGVGPRTMAEHLTAVQTLAGQLLSYRNVYIDVSNERDVGDDRYVSLPDCGQLISAIKAIDPGRLCTASSNPSSQTDLNNHFVQGKMDFIAPHLCRSSGCAAQTVGTVEEYITWMTNLGFRAPIHLQEPFRLGYATYQPTLEDFLRDCSGGKVAEAAGWCLHNGAEQGGVPYRCFNMSNAYGRLYSQWASVEQQVCDQIDNTIGGVSTKVRRYQAEYAEQLAHQIGRKDGFTWSANVAQDAAGYLSYGPYITTVPAGTHLATWRLRIDSISGNNDVVTRIDVVRNGGATTLAQADIRRQDFAAANNWQEFTLSFTSNAGDNLEFRTYWYDLARIDLDWITLAMGFNPQLAFTDITAGSGTGGPSNNGEYGGHGIMWADVTGDTRSDFYVTMNRNQSMGELFYRNVNGASFVEEAQARGIHDYDTGSHGGVWADLDNDGDYDLVNGAYQRNEVYENNGTGNFTNRTASSGFENVNYGTRGTVAFDFDNDGDLDVFCNNWGPGEENEFYRNNGGWSFTRTDNGLRYIGGVQGCTEGDFDNDGDLDLLIGQGYGTMGGADGPLMVMRNTGGSFSNVTSAVGLSSTSPQQQGSVFCDINNDGWLDLHIQRDTGNSQLYMNDGDGTFTQASVANGPGFMANFEDLDNDGDWDMVYAGDNKVYLNDGNGNFTTSSTFSLGTINDPRAVAFADIDNDGDMDFFYAQKGIYNILIRNDLSNGGNWLKVRLVGPNGQAGAFGAKVRTYEAGHAGEAAYLISFREARSQEGYLGQNDPVLHFGLGPRISADVRVTFLDGTVMTAAGVGVNQTITIDASPAEPPVIAEVTPDPDSAMVGIEYIRQLTLLQGSLPVTWSIIQGPSGIQVDVNGRVFGWVPTSEQADTTQTIEVRADNGVAPADTETWNVDVAPDSGLGTYPFDSHTEGWAIEGWAAGQYGPGTIAWTGSGGHPGGNILSAGSGATNNADNCTREGTRMTRVISTAGYKDIQLHYDVIAALATPPASGCTGDCASGLLGGTCDDKLVVSYSISGVSGPWISAETMGENDLPTEWMHRQIDLSGTAETRNNADFAVRFEWQFNTSADTGRIDNVSVQGTPWAAAAADFDGDGDVDQDDFGFFQLCLSGNGQPYATGCAPADLTGDGDVDEGDFALFFPCMGGADREPACE